MGISVPESRSPDDSDPYPHQGANRTRSHTLSYRAASTNGDPQARAANFPSQRDLRPSDRDAYAVVSDAYAVSDAHAVPIALVALRDADGAGSIGNRHQCRAVPTPSDRAGCNGDGDVGLAADHADTLPVAL